MVRAAAVWLLYSVSLATYAGCIGIHGECTYYNPHAWARMTTYVSEIEWHIVNGVQPLVWRSDGGLIYRDRYGDHRYVPYMDSDDLDPPEVLGGSSVP